MRCFVRKTAMAGGCACINWVTFFWLSRCLSANSNPWLVCVGMAPNQRPHQEDVSNSNSRQRQATLWDPSVARESGIGMGFDEQPGRRRNRRTARRRAIRGTEFAFPPAAPERGALGFAAGLLPNEWVASKITGGRARGGWGCATMASGVAPHVRTKTRVL